MDITLLDLYKYIANNILFSPTKNRIKSQLPSTFLFPLGEMRKKIPPLFILPPTRFWNYFLRGPSSEKIKNVSDAGNITYLLLIEYDIQKVSHIEYIVCLCYTNVKVMQNIKI